MAQVRAYLGAIERMTAERRLAEAIVARMAQADGKAWKNYTKKLERAAHGR